MLRTLEQKRAKFAWDCVTEITNKCGALQKKYSSYVKKAPILILTNGLDNTMAFLRAKKSSKQDQNNISDEKKAYDLLYKHINKWFKKSTNNKTDLLEWIIDSQTTSISVFHVTREILSFLNWLKRFSEAELKSGDEHDEI